MSPCPAALLAAVLTLAACAHDDPAPNYSTVSPTPSAPSSTSSSPPTPMNTRPGETSPTPLADVDEDTSDAALAFATYYIQTVDWVLATGDVDSLRPFYATDCTTCQSRLQFFQSLFSDGSYQTGGRVHIQQQALVTNDGRLGADFAVSTEVSIDAGAVVDSSGATASTQPEVPSFTVTTWLAWSGVGWKLVEERYA